MSKFNFDGFMWLKPNFRYWRYIEFYAAGTLGCGFALWFFTIGWSWE